MCGWGWGVFSEISSGVVLGEVCWYINMCELLVDYCDIASCCCLSQVVIMRAQARIITTWLKQQQLAISQ